MRRKSICRAPTPIGCRHDEAVFPCRQPQELRTGVRLSPLKAHIFDVVEHAGSNGITIEDINTICLDGRASAVNVRNHIHQINDAPAGTDFEIRGGAPGMVGYFHIVKRHWSAVP